MTNKLPSPILFDIYVGKPSGTLRNLAVVIERPNAASGKDNRIAINTNEDVIMLHWRQESGVVSDRCSGELHHCSRTAVKWALLD